MIRFILTVLALLALLFFGWLFEAPKLVLALLAMAVAVKHMAYILIVGNIFQPVRTAILRAEQRRERNSFGRLFFRKLRVLFSCNLCMTTWVSVLTAAIPASYLAHMRYGHIAQNLAGGSLSISAEWFLTALGTFLVAMAVAGVAMAVWRVTELPAELLELYEAMRREREANEHVTNFDSMPDDGMTRNREEVFAALGEEGVVSFLFDLHRKCEEVSHCIFRMNRCMREAIPEALGALLVKYKLKPREIDMVLEQLVELADQYKDEMMWERRDEAYFPIRAEFARQFMANPLGFAYDESFLEQASQ